MKTRIARKKMVVAGIAAFIIILLLQIDLMAPDEIRPSAKQIVAHFFLPNGVLSLLCFGFLYLIYIRALEIADRRVMKYATVLSLLFSLIYITGTNLEQYDGIRYMANSWPQLLKHVGKFLGLSGLFYAALLLLLNYLYTLKLRKTSGAPGRYRFFRDWGIIFACWFVCFLCFFPGSVSDDSVNQLQQALGVSDWNNHHPVFHTFLIFLCMKIGGLFGSNMLGVVIYSLGQMLCLSAAFAYTLHYMRKREVNKTFVLCSLVYFSLYPVHGFYSFTMWKDIPFALCMLFFTLFCAEIALNPQKILKSGTKTAGFLVVLLATALFRNNGIHVLFLSLPVLFFCAKGFRMRIVAMVFVCFSLYYIYTGPVFSAFHIKAGSIREALSIPLQQTARVMKYHEQELSDAEKELINKILPAEHIGADYNPRKSNAVKDHFSDQGFKEYKWEYLSLWLKMFCRYPEEYISSFLCNNYGYYYPEASYWVVHAGISPNSLGIAQPFSWQEQADSLALIFFSGVRKIPVFSMLFSIGFAFYILLICVVLCCLKRKYRLLIAYVPVLALFLTVLASPVYAEFRYVYSLFTCLPVLVSFALEARSDHFVKNKPDFS